MKRRGFLQMLGGAVAVPLMPNVSVGAAAKVAYPASALHAAIYHAQSRVNFSVFSLARQLGLNMDQAEQLMSDMSTRGILGPLQGTTQSGRWALSRVWQRPFVDAAAAQKVARKSNRRTSDANHSVSEHPSWSADLRPFLRGVYRIAARQGHDLHPRCHALAA